MGGLHEGFTAIHVKPDCKLAGHSTQLVRKVIDQLAFTPGAKAKLGGG